MTYTVKQLKQAAYNAGFRGHNLVIAVAVSLAENPSRDPHAINRANSNGTQDYGAWQINSIHSEIFGKYKWDNLSDNARMAKYVYDMQGWSAWTTYKSKAYAPHLSKAQHVKINRSSHSVADAPASQGGSSSSDSGGGLPGPLGWAVDLGTGAIGAAIQGGEHTAGTIVSTTQGLGKILGYLTDPEFWKRVGLVTAALLILIIGVVILLLSSKTTRKVLPV